MRNLPGSAVVSAWNSRQSERNSTAWRQTADDIIAYLDQQTPLQASVADVTRSYYHRLGRAPSPQEISLARSNSGATPSNDHSARCVECEQGEVGAYGEYVTAAPELISARCKRIKNLCIGKCLYTLPTGDAGFRFWNCLNACMKDFGC